MLIAYIQSVFKIKGNGALRNSKGVAINLHMYTNNHNRYVDKLSMKLSQ